MNSAVITPCSHFFHAGCLKKWLYVQETCPLCHSQLKSQSPATSVPNQDVPAANQSPAGQEEATAGNKEKDGSSNEKEDRSVEQEGENEPAALARESTSSSGMHIVRHPSSSSSCCPSPLVSNSQQNQLPADHSSSSSSSSSTSDTLDMPGTPPSHSHTVSPSIFHHSSSEVPVHPEMISTEPEPTLQLNSLDRQDSSPEPPSQSEQLACHSEEYSPSPCSL